MAERQPWQILDLQEAGLFWLVHAALNYDI